MKTYGFDVVVKDTSEVSDDQADALFAAGCDDGTPACCNGCVWIHFDREASSLEEAIRSAVAQVGVAGFRVAKVELDVSTKDQATDDMIAFLRHWRTTHPEPDEQFGDAIQPIISVAHPLAVADETAIANSTKPTDSLVTISEETSPTGRVWRVHYGSCDFVSRRGGGLIVLVEDRTEAVSVIRGQ